MRARENKLSQWTRFVQAKSLALWRALVKNHQFYPFAFNKAPQKAPVSNPSELLTGAYTRNETGRRQKKNAPVSSPHGLLTGACMAPGMTQKATLPREWHTNRATPLEWHTSRRVSPMEWHRQTNRSFRWVKKRKNQIWKNSPTEHCSL